MRRIADLPFRVRELENVWIPVRDGVRLAARAWLPEGAEKAPVPAILEYIPYRKRDMTALRDTGTHGYLAGHGYGCVRLDVRGVGESEGLYGDQFAGQYVEDALDVIAWLARQPWCSGDVAMFGLSWGAAIAMQTASRRPAALKTIVCAAGIDDRYELRYPGGCLATSTLSAIVAQMSYASRPPDPDIVGSRWRDMWLARLEATEPMDREWLTRPARDKRWRAASISDDYGAITCPTMISAGWADPAFATSMMRSLDRLAAPRLGIFGPWAHRYPHLGIPGPAIDYLGETLRWLDHWLKGRDTGIMQEPKLRAWLPRGFTVSPTPEVPVGRWIGAATWCASGTSPCRYWLGASGLAADPPGEGWADLPSALLISGGPGEFMPLFASERGPELPGEQSDDDACSLVFDSPPLDASIELLGTPLARLTLATDTNAGQIVVRLCAVAPDGRSRRISWGARNLALTDDFSAPRSKDGLHRTVTIDVPMYSIADTLAAGHRLRIGLSTSYWPLIWPPAAPSRISVALGRSWLSLPVRSDDVACGGFDEPRSASTWCWTGLRPGGYRRSEETDAATGERILTITDDMGVGRIEEVGLEIGEATVRTFRIRPDDPASAGLLTETKCTFSRGDWSAETIALGEVRHAGNELATRHELRANENGQEVFSRTWRRLVPQHL